MKMLKLPYFFQKMNSSFKENGTINSNTVKQFFNHTKNLMFDKQAASLEQNAVLEIINDIPNNSVHQVKYTSNDCDMVNPNTKNNEKTFGG